MTKDEARLSVMGAISMALKDPTLQQGFEIICKNLSELEKENAELKLKLEALDGQVPWEDIKDKSEIIGKLTEAKDLLITYKDFLEYDALTTRLGNLYDRTVRFLKES